MKYIKKDKYKDTNHLLKDNKGTRYYISSNELEDTELNKVLYERHKFMFDVVKETQEATKIVETIVDIVEEEKVEEIVDSETEKTILERLDECKTKKEIEALASENNIDLDARIRNIKKLKEDFLERYNK